MYPIIDSAIDPSPADRYLSLVGAPSPIVVGGVGGSGTRLVVQLLQDANVAMGQHCNAAGDSMPFVPLYDKYINSYLGGVVQPAEFAQSLIGAIAEHRGKEPLSGPWGWKNPRSIYLLPLLDQAVTGLRFIHVVRDGLAMADSSNQAQLYKHGDIVLPEDMHTLDNAQRALMLWAIVNHAAADYGGRMGNRYLRIRYEDICYDPRTASVELARAFGLTGRNSGTLAIRPPRTRAMQCVTTTDTVVSETVIAALRRFGYPC
jgi:hypothetical protein